MPILDTPMRFPENPEGGSDRGTLRRPEPFVTILDAKPLKSQGRMNRETLRVDRKSKLVRSPVSRLKKETVRARSFMGDKAEEAGKALALTGRKAFGFGRKLSLGTGALAASIKARAAVSPDPVPDAAEPAASAGKSRAASLSEAFTGAMAGIRAWTSPKNLRIFFAITGAAAALSVGAGALIDAREFPLSAGHMSLPDEESVQSALIAYLQPEASEDPPDSMKLPPVPVSVKLTTYTIRSGDTIDRIAKRFGVRQDTIISANNLQSASSIRPGVALRIPNMDGVSHKVRRGESLSSLSKSFGIELTKIVDANDLSSGTIAIGQVLFIPNARLSASTLRDFYGEKFIWPARGIISSPFGYRSNPFSGLKTYHSAIDIVVPQGTRVKATTDGKVADTGYNSVFGNYVIVQHSGGYQSLYAHLSSIQVKEGTSIAQGSQIGLSGNTGQSTGPHLHFSIFKNGQALDPVKYVK